MKRLLLVDDEKNMLSVLELLFRHAGHEVLTAGSAEEALERVNRDVDLVVSDLRLPGMDGIRFLRELRSRGVASPFVLITAYGSVDKAVEVMKLGAVDVLTKPFAKEDILSVVNQCLSKSQRAIHKESNPILPEGSIEGLVWAGPAMAELVGLMRKVGPVNLPVLLTGESGTGKDLVARALHSLYAGRFDSAPFVPVNCPAVPEHLLESEMFGFRRGAFTGANHDFRGKVEQADGGTLFFDEIGDLPLSIQPKLLRLLESHSYEALGSAQTRNVDIRVICATNRDLRSLVRNGSFREDLYYRINAFSLEIPSLRDRREEIPALAGYFLKRGADRLSRPSGGFDPEALAALIGYDWPGNVRELRNVIERALVLAAGSSISLKDLPEEFRTPAGQAQSHDVVSTLDASERHLILDALAIHQGNVSAAARHLGISRNTLRYRMHKHGVAEMHQVTGS